MVVMTAPAMRVFDLKLREYSNKTKAYTFSASELKPNKKGIWGKYYMRVQSEIVPKFERLKIRNGSIVDIVATPNYYVGKDGKYGMEWEVKDISISDIPYSAKQEEANADCGDASSNARETQEETLASILLGFTTNMFTE